MDGSSNTAMATTRATPDDAAIGAAARIVLAMLPAQAQLIVRLDPDQRRAAAAAQLDSLEGRGVLSAGEIDTLRRQLAANGGTHSATSAPSAQEAVTGANERAGIRELTVAGLLTTAIGAQSVTFSILDTLWDAAVTIIGVIAGESIGGPGGALIGGLAAHQWATENPPSTWFE